MPQVYQQRSLKLQHALRREHSTSVWASVSRTHSMLCFRFGDGHSSTKRTILNSQIAKYANEQAETVF